MKTFLDKAREAHPEQQKARYLEVCERYEIGLKELLNAKTFTEQMLMCIKIREILLIDPFARWWAQYKKDSDPQIAGSEDVARIAFNEGRASSRLVAKKLAERIFSLYMLSDSQNVNREKYLKDCEEVFNELLRA
jgi:hypothetical protein